MDVRVSPEINSVLDTATSISIGHGRYYVGVEHLFEALLERKDLFDPGFITKHWPALGSVMRSVDLEAWQGSAPSPGEVFYTPRCAVCTSEAANQSRCLRTGKLGAEHLLLAILLDPDSAPSRAMDRLEIGRTALIDELRSMLGPANQASVRMVAPASRLAQDSGPEPEEVGAPTLEVLATDLTAAAREGRLGPAIGRDREILEVMQILTRKTKNNAVLVGEPGVGKTKIVEGLAVASAKGSLGGLLSGSRVLELNMAAFLSGTEYRGAMEKRLIKLLEELKRSPEVILFIDEMHLIMGAGATGEGSIDLANLMKPALARGEFRCIGATTFKEFRRFIEKDPAFERRFQMVRVEPLSDEATLEVLLSMRPALAKHHGIRIPRDVLPEVISLSKRYLPDRQLPDKAIDVLDQACARYRLKMVSAKEGVDFSLTGLAPDGNHEVTLHEVRKVISQLTAIPLEQLTAAERVRLDDLDNRLRKKIIGQDEAVAKVVASVKKARVGITEPNRPDGSFLFLGPTGVGKTQLAKELAAAVFGSPHHLLSFDMGEYIEEHSVSRLLGAPPGYVGSEEEGRLTGAVRSAPYSVLLFDEIEKAHPRIFDIFLPILDEGRLKDSRGRDVSFRNCIIIMTSNVGTELLTQDHTADRRALTNELARHFRAEFLNRIDEIVPFYPLLFEDIRAILLLLIKDLTKRLLQQKYDLRMYQKAYEYLAEQGYSAEFGARELKRTVDQLVANPIGDLVVSGQITPGDVIDVLIEGGRLVFRKGAPRRKRMAGVSA